jgi:UPF0716 protein FxsA
MSILPFFLLLFIGIPLLEIYLLISVGGAIGAFPTVFAVLFTAVLGVSLIRIQGISTIQKAQKSMAQGLSPAAEMFAGVFLLFAAVCLLIPGFFTDAIGFLLLIPPFRTLLVNFLIGSQLFRARFRNNSQPSSGVFIDGEYENITPEQQHEQNQNRLYQQNIIEGTVEKNEN